jgi:hypothetical protein
MLMKKHDTCDVIIFECIFKNMEGVVIAARVIVHVVYNKRRI